ncbi:TraR/DksA family transcriptional regulator [Wenjunlia tyrosinilytica]|jgi:RNA polymerase-binding protein DksA|uniref:DnaK suppressor protein n=1 Tax=Wenjunlia tyrosinilytica TaxID=1544741 RepID=A0A918E195_9ACTN|nr:TraR/DksA C4-type zinc finger protein [Wenjunlia tyrosinilytica]GGO95628.1 DnaK suppressor protein [Wenjunlia tyrosinilytica]
MSDASRDADFCAVRERLEAERASTSAQIGALSRDFTAIVEANALVAIDDEHDPEGSSTAFERAHVASLLARAREHLADLDQALERLENGEYGRCEVCGEPIPTERLEVRPAARTCVRCAEARIR